MCCPRSPVKSERQYFAYPRVVKHGMNCAVPNVLRMRCRDTRAVEAYNRLNPGGVNFSGMLSLKQLRLLMKKL